MKQYLELLQDILDNGVEKGDRTGTGTLSVFGRQLRFENIGEKFPLITTKKMFLKGIIHELIWFLNGDTNIKYLNDNGVHIWDEWADRNGDLGPVYGSQWRKWEYFEEIPVSTGNPLNPPVMRFKKFYIDQIENLINEIKSKPNSRRMIVTAWNPAEVDNMALPPCHCLYQFNVANGKLSCQLYQRSCDVFLGVPFNIASYALLTMMVAQICDLEPGDFIHTFGDVHIYSNHVEQVREQLSREPFDLPKIVINSEVKNIDEFKYEDFRLENYQCHPTIKAPIAV